MTLWIDGDGCPVVKLAVETAQKYQVPSVIVCDEAHSFTCTNGEVLQVAKGMDSVDFAIATRLQKGDIVITQDYG
ncbi:MAG: hypothetical protein GX786_00675, partial [Clostridiales bacterium]|nr:hypothetical protein [Clostridiales bacterium]